MDARTSYFSSEIKDLQFKFKSLRNDHEVLKQEVKLLVRVLLHNKELEKQYKKLEEDKWKY